MGDKNENKELLLLKVYPFTLSADLHLEGGQNKNGRVASPERVPIHLKKRFLCFCHNVTRFLLAMVEWWDGAGYF